MPTSSLESIVYFNSSDSVREARLTHLANGGWVVSWTGQDDGEASAYYDFGIYQQVYSADGTAIGVPQLVNTTTYGRQEDVTLTELSDGGWIAVWDDSVWDQYGGLMNGIRMQRFDSSGNKVGTEAQVANTLGSAHDANVILLEDGGWCISWSESGRDEFGNVTGWNAYTAKFDSLGNAVTGPIQVNSNPTSFESEARSAALPDGGWLVVYTGYSDPYLWWQKNEIFIRRYDADGNLVSRSDGIGNAPDELVNTTVSEAQFDPSIDILSDGGWVVTWTSNEQDGYWNGVYQQRYSASGQKIGVETQVNTTTEFDQKHSNVGALPDGGWVVTWTSTENVASGDETVSIYQQRFDANGDRVGTESRVNTTTADENYYGSLDVLTDGSWVITWQAWEDGVGSKIKQRHFSADYVGGQEEEPASPQIFHGTSGNDVILGSAEADHLIGYAGDDVYTVNDVGDLVIEQGNAGTDRVKASIDHVLATNVEELVLTGSAAIDGTGNDLDNRLFGNGANNTLFGLGGNDRLSGFGGSDQLSGGNGNDQLNGGIGADLMAGGRGNDIFIIDSNFDKAIEFAGEGIDTVKASVNYTLAANIENLALTGSSALGAGGNGLANTISGNGGANIISGLAGNDKLFGGAGADRLSGGTGKDLLAGGTGNDILTGGSGADLFVFSGHRDRATDFQARIDALDLRGMRAITDLYDLVHNHVRVSGDDLILNAGSHRLMLENVSVSELKASDILYFGGTVPREWHFAG